MPEKNTDTPFFSIIMVTFNAQGCIERSLDSLVAQSCNDWGLRLVDGASTDGTLDIVQSYRIQYCTVTSQRDNGIYDAMNYGAATSEGKWLLFLNAGDELFDRSVLETVKRAILSMERSPDVVYGDVQVCSEQSCDVKTQHVLSARDFIFTIPLCHQSIFYDRGCFSDGRHYDLRFCVCSDYHHLAYLYRAGLVFRKINCTIAKYTLGGFSHRKLQTLELERLLIVNEIFGGVMAVCFFPKFCFLYTKALILRIFEKCYHWRSYNAA